MFEFDQKKYVVSLTKEEKAMEDNERRTVFYVPMTGKQFAMYQRQANKLARRVSRLQANLSGLLEERDALEVAAENASEEGDVDRVRELNRELDRCESKIEDKHEEVEQAQAKSMDLQTSTILQFIRGFANFPTKKKWDKLSTEEQGQLLDYLSPGFHNMEAQSQLFTEIIGGLEDEEKKPSEDTSNESISNESETVSSLENIEA
jgi:outer membrane murein-binding lipoprotein Lpp